MKRQKTLNLENRTLDQVKELLNTSRLVEAQYMKMFKDGLGERYRKAAQRELNIQLACVQEIELRNNAEKTQLLNSANQTPPL